MKSGRKIGLSLTFALLSLFLLLIGCPAQIVPMPDDGGDEAAPQDSSIDMDAGSDVKIVEAGDAGYNFDLQSPYTGTIMYHGGPVMTQPVHVYLLWYGNWNNNTAVPIVEDLITGLSESPYFSITSTYYEELVASQTLPKIGIANQVFATDHLIFDKSVFVGYTHGMTLTDDDVFAVVSDAIDGKQVPSDPEGIYLVLTSADVKKAWFCAVLCGYHDHRDYNGVDLKFAFIGDPAPCLDGCSAKPQYDAYGFTHSPNFNWSADAMASVIAHELSETCTDPDWENAPAWSNADQTEENADMCSWTYGKLYTTDSGSVANVKLGTRDYLLQQNWLLDTSDAGQRCAMHP